MLLAVPLLPPFLMYDPLIALCVLAALLAFAPFYWHERKQRAGRGLVASPRAIPARAASAPDASSPPTHVERCATLRATGRFAEAARVAREGLAGEAEPSPLLIELSRAELGVGRVYAAIDVARDAYFACRSRESLSHLIRILTETRRFAFQDGLTLRRAASRHPQQALLRHAAGVFESMYGEPGAAAEELRAALRLEPDAALRQRIARDLARAEKGLAQATLRTAATER